MRVIASTVQTSGREDDARANSGAQLANAVASQPSAQEKQAEPTFDGVLLSLLQQAGSTQKANQRTTLQSEAQAQGDEQARLAIKKEPKVKALATTQAEDTLAGKEHYGPTAAAEAALVAGQRPADRSSNNEGAGQMSQHNGRARVRPGTESGSFAGSSAQGGGGEARDANLAGNTLRNAGAIQTSNVDGAASQTSVQSTMRALASATRVATQSVTAAAQAAPSQTGRSHVGPSQAISSQASSSQSSHSHAGQANNAKDPKPEPFKQLSHAGAHARTKALQQGVEQAMTQGLSLALKEGGGTATVRLAPESLGQLAIKLTVQDGEVTVRAQTQTDSARELLADSVPALKEALESKGLHVRELHVHGPEESASMSPKQDALESAVDKSHNDQDDRGGLQDGGGASDNHQQHNGRGPLASGKDAVAPGEELQIHAERDEHTEHVLLEAGALQWIA